MVGPPVGPSYTTSHGNNIEHRWHTPPITTPRRSCNERGTPANMLTAKQSTTLGRRCIHESDSARGTPAHRRLLRGANTAIILTKGAHGPRLRPPTGTGRPKPITSPIIVRGTWAGTHPNNLPGGNPSDYIYPGTKETHQKMGGPRNNTDMNPPPCRSLS